MQQYVEMACANLRGTGKCYNSGLLFFFFPSGKLVKHLLVHHQIQGIVLGWPKSSF